MATHAAPATTTDNRPWWRRLISRHPGLRYRGAPPQQPPPAPRGRHHARVADLDATVEFRQPLYRRKPYPGESPLVRSAYDTLARLQRLDLEEG